MTVVIDARAEPAFYVTLKLPETFDAMRSLASLQNGNDGESSGSMQRNCFVGH